MANSTRSTARKRFEPFLEPEPVLFASDGMPLLYEDENEGDMGEVSWHSDAVSILHICLDTLLAKRGELRVYANMNLHYRKRPLHRRTRSKPYVSPDVMVVAPFILPTPEENVTSYTIGEDGPAPLATIECLSRRSAQQRDLKEKAKVYARLGVAEYMLVDQTGRFLKKKLQLWRLQANGRWSKEQDADGGITSRQLGFRIILDTDNQVRLIDSTTGITLPRPREAMELSDIHLRIQELEKEIAKVRNQLRNKP